MEIILHHFDSSPFAEKVRLALGLKNLEWSSVEIPMVMPKPNLTALTGGYTYPRDDVQLVTQTVFPAQGATGVPQSLQSACVLLTAPMSTSTTAIRRTVPR